MQPGIRTCPSVASAGPRRRTCRPAWSLIVAAVAATVLPAAPALALVPGDLCTGNPCVVSDDFVVEAGTVLDFGSTTDLQIAPRVKVLILNGATLDIEAGSIVVGNGVKVFAASPGSSLYFSAETGNITVGDNRSSARFLLRDSIELGFFCQVDCFVNAIADLSGKTDEGGVFYVQALGAAELRGKVTSDSLSKGDFNAGSVDLDAGAHLAMRAKLRARGQIADSGQMLLRGASVEVLGSIDVKSKGGGGGTINVTAQTGDITIDGKIDADGKRAPDDEFSDNCDGGSVDFTAPQSIVVKKKVSARGGGRNGCSGGLFTAQAGADFEQLPSAQIRTSTAGYISYGGDVVIDAAGNVTLRNIDVGSDNAGSIGVTAGGTLASNGHLRAASNGSGDQADGTVGLTGTCGLTVPSGATIKAARSNAFGGVVALVTSGGPMSIGGKIDASDAVDITYVTGFDPVITGRVNPAPNLVEVPTGTCGP